MQTDSGGTVVVYIGLPVLGGHLYTRIPGSSFWVLNIRRANLAVGRQDTQTGLTE